MPKILCHIFCNGAGRLRFKKWDVSFFTLWLHGALSDSAMMLGQPSLPYGGVH